MNTLDIILLALFVPGIVRGLRKGILEQAIGLAGLFISYFLAKRFYVQAGELAGRFLTDASPQILSTIGFILVMTASLIVLILLSRLLTKVVEMASLGWVNRLLGVVLACFITAMVIGLTANLFDILNSQFSLVKEGSVLETSVVYPALRDFASTVLPFIKSLFNGTYPTA